MGFRMWLEHFLFGKKNRLRAGFYGFGAHM
jgi:hypothetical protein